MYTNPIRHRTPNIIEGMPMGIGGIGPGMGDVADYIPAGVTQAWDEIKGQVSDVTASRWFGYTAIGLGAILIWATVAGMGGRRKYRGKR